jgi:cystathionine beta-synthase
MKVHDNVLSLIGSTPLLKVSGLNSGLCEIFLKLESANPGGSIKDRIALSMVSDAEERGLIHPGDTLIEATAGNTGVGLALVARQKGYDLKIVIPDKMSIEKIHYLRAMGAEVILTRSDVTKGHPAYYQDLAMSISKKTGAFYVNQFGNKANVAAHYSTTGPEIWQQMEGEVDAFVCGVGTGGTLSGVGQFLREKNKNVDLILADPEGSILAPFINSGHEPKEVGSWYVEGIGEDFVPDICDLSLVTQAYSISDKEAFETARKLLLTEGVIAGSSTGTLVAAALHYCLEQKKPKRVVTLVCDTGNRYLSKVYNDNWVKQHIPELNL